MIFRLLFTTKIFPRGFSLNKILTNQKNLYFCIAILNWAVVSRSLGIRISPELIENIGAVVSRNLGIRISPELIENIGAVVSRNLGIRISPELIENIGAVVQLVRISACHAGGRGFESRPHRFHTLKPLEFQGVLFFATKSATKSAKSATKLFPILLSRLLMLEPPHTVL